MTQLYINDKHCLSVEQLKGYFTEDLTSDSVIYYDILDYGRYGDISQWLQELGEDELSAKVASIDNTLSDSEYFIELKKIITGYSEPTPFDSLKPSFEKCFQYEGYEEEPNGSTEIVVLIKFKILMSVNESYELKVSSSWGTRGQQINPSDYIEGETIKISFSFRKRPGKEWEIVNVKLDNNGTETEQERDLLKLIKNKRVKSTNNRMPLWNRINQMFSEAISQAVVEIEKEQEQVLGISTPVHNNGTYSWRTEGYKSVIEQDRIKREQHEKEVEEKRKQHERNEMIEKARERYKRKQEKKRR